MTNEGRAYPQLLGFLQKKYGFEIPAQDDPQAYDARFNAFWSADAAIIAVRSLNEHQLFDASGVVRNDTQKLTDKAYLLARAAREMHVANWDEVVRNYVTSHVTHDDGFADRTFKIEDEDRKRIIGQQLLDRMAAMRANGTPQERGA